MSELAIDDIHFDDFSLDVDAMITAALRMFMELSGWVAQGVRTQTRESGCLESNPVSISFQ